VTYFIRPVERDLMPDGHDWLFINERGGDQHFVVASDVGSLVLPDQALEAIIRSVVEHTQLGTRVA
jgi:hypothetical protein